MRQFPPTTKHKVTEMQSDYTFKKSLYFRVGRTKTSTYTVFGVFTFRVKQGTSKSSNSVIHSAFK